MPRSRGGAGPARAPARPQAMPARPAAPPAQQQRPMSTTTQAARPGQAGPPAVQQQSQSPGLFGQMASTAAGVAVGSSIGHAIGGFFGGGSSAAPAAESAQYQQPVDNYSQPGSMYNTTGTSQDSATASGPCALDIKNFTSCMNQNQGDMNVCSWYLEQLKACQAAASRY